MTGSDSAECEIRDEAAGEDADGPVLAEVSEVQAGEGLAGLRAPDDDPPI